MILGRISKKGIFRRGLISRNVSRSLSVTSSCSIVDAEAVVVGGGAVGSSTAYHLAKRGVKTMLLDKDK